MLILSLLAIKLYRFFLAFFVRFWKQMQCIVSQPLPFLVLQNAYLVAKIQIYIGLEQTIILKNIIPQLLFSIFLIAPLHVSQSMSCRQCSKRTLQEYRHAAILPYFIIGGKVLYRESDIQALLESNYSNHQNEL